MGVLIGLVGAMEPCCLCALQTGSVRGSLRPLLAAVMEMCLLEALPAVSRRSLASCSPIGLILILNKTKSLEMK